MSYLDSVVIINRKCALYPNFPYNPSTLYPELKKMNFNVEVSSTKNYVYELIRKSLYKLGLDKKNFNTIAWNPFSDFIKPGDFVVVKPNLVLHFVECSNASFKALITHTSVIRVVIDYLLLALKGKGKIIIGDAPHGNADFNQIIQLSRLKELINWYKERKIFIELIDFRKFIYGFGKNGFIDSKAIEVNNDPNGYVLVNLGEKSCLNNLSNLNRLYGSDYDRKFIVRNHTNKTHNYLISKTVLKSNVLINIPKLKTHKKTGVTICLKNLVGINGDKRYLPHYRIGPPSLGGDEYPNYENILLQIIYWWDRFSRDNLLIKEKNFYRNIYKYLSKFFGIFRKFYKVVYKKNIIINGNWIGNDTAWRMVFDLNYILLFSDENGKLNLIPQRKIFNVVDGIIAGEGNGPMSPIPKNLGLVAVGFNSFVIDYILTQMIGFDVNKVKLIKNIFTNPLFKFNSKKLNNYCEIDNKEIPCNNVNLGFIPANNWEEVLKEKK